MNIKSKRSKTVHPVEDPESRYLEAVCGANAWSNEEHWKITDKASNCKSCRRILERRIHRDR